MVTGFFGNSVWSKAVVQTMMTANTITRSNDVGKFMTGNCMHQISSGKSVFFWILGTGYWLVDPYNATRLTLPMVLEHLSSGN